MTEHEHHQKTALEHEEAPATKPKNNWYSSRGAIAASVLLGAVLISGSIFYGTNAIIKKIVAPEQAASNVGTAQVGGTQAAAAPAQPGGPVTITDRANEPTLGNKDAKVTMVEFGDFQCPFCKQYFQQNFAQIKSQYIDTGKVKLIFRDFPLTQIHVNAQIAAVAAECANQQGQFWAYHDLLYTNGQSDGTDLDKASLEKYADQLGLNKGTLGFGKDKFNQCLESNATLPIVQADQAEGTKDGVTGTPTFFINGVQIVGAQPLSTFQAALDNALKQ